jgi:ATP-dependent helicase/nuclease subunit A
MELAVTASDREFVPSPEQEKAIARQGHTAVLAGAGSGKTSVIVEWYCRALLDYLPHARIDQVVAVTFTEKAAGELKARVRRRLKELARKSERGEMPPEYKQRIAELEPYLSVAPIGTIHSFCGKILRQFWAEAGVDPSFVIVDELREERLIDQSIQLAIGAWEQGKVEQRANLLTLLSAFGTQSRLAKDVRQMLRRRGEFLKPVKHFCEHSVEELVSEWSTNTLVWGIIERMLRENLEKHARIVTELKWVAPLQPAVSALLDAIRAYKNADNPRARLEAAQKWLSLIFDEEGNERAELAGAYKTTRRPATIERRELKKKVDAALNAELLPASLALNKIVAEFFAEALTRYETLCCGQKNSEGTDLMDFAELELRTARLLADNEKVRQQLRSQIAALIVDEYQDTSRVQWEIFQRLTGLKAEPGSARGPWLFVVGDPAQAIYGWRQASTDVFYDTINAILGAQTGTDSVVPLRRNYRTQEPVLAFINQVCSEGVFKPVDDTSGDEGTVATSGFAPLEAVRPDAGGRTLWIETAYTPRNKRSDKKTSSEQDVESEREGAQSLGPSALVEARSIATALKLLIENQNAAAVAGEDGKSRRRYSWGDVGILCRKRKLFAPIEDTLRAYGIPYRTYSSTGFYEQPEVRDVLSAMRVVADAKDDLAVLGYLRGGLVRCSDALLFKLAHCPGHSLWSRCHAALSRDAGENADLRLTELERQRVQFATETIGTIRQRLGIVSVDRLIADLIERTGAWGIYGAGPLAEQARENLKKLIELTRALNTSSLSAFIEYVDEHEERELIEGEAPLAEAGVDAVSVMTVHAAKGLQFPIVVLPSLDRSANQKARFPCTDGELWFACGATTDPESGPRFESLGAYLSFIEEERQEREERRVFYVALTRVEDYLILSSTGSSDVRNEKTPVYWLSQFGWQIEVENGWDGVAALFAQPPMRVAVKMKVPPLPPPAPIAPADGVVAAPADILYEHNRAAADALYGEFAGERLGWRAELYDWPTLAPPPAFSTHVMSVHVTEFATFAVCPRKYFYDHVLETRPFLSEESGKKSERAGDEPAPSLPAADRGTLLHALIEQLLGRGDTANENVSTLIESMVRSGMLDVAGGDSAALEQELTEHIQAALDDGKFDAIRAARWARFEQPYMAAIDDELQISGTLDCEFENPQGEVEVVDFKTGLQTHEEDGLGDVYDMQVRLYLWMIAQRFPQQSRYRGTLLYTAKGRKPHVVELSRAEMTAFGEAINGLAHELRAFWRRYAHGDLIPGSALDELLALECARREKPCRDHSRPDNG